MKRFLLISLLLPFVSLGDDCVKMSAIVCTEIKSKLSAQRSALADSIDSLTEKFDDVDSLLEPVQTSIDDAISALSGAQEKFDAIDVLTYPIIDLSDQAYYSSFWDSVDSDSGVRDLIGRIGMYPSQQQNIISSNYPTWSDIDTVIGSLGVSSANISDIASSLSSAREDVSSMGSSLDDIRDTLNDIDCTDCGCGDSGSGGGSGDTGGGGCPCEALIEQIKLTLYNISDNVSAIKSEVESYLQYLHHLSDIADDVSAIKDSVAHIDDYHLDDIREKLGNIKTSLSSLQVSFLKSDNSVQWWKLYDKLIAASFDGSASLLHQDYSNATQFLDDSGSSIDWLQKGETIEKPTGGYTIDFGEYKSLNWFQRMEFLVGHLAGIFSKTNSTNQDFTDEQKEQISEIEDGVQWTKDFYYTPKGIVEGMISKVENAASSLNPFKNVFSYGSGNSKKITILPDVSVESALICNTFPTVELDLSQSGDGSFSLADIIELSHNITTFLAFVFFAIFDILAIYKFVLALIAINRWYWKVYHSWVSTMFNGGGR